MTAPQPRVGPTAVAADRCSCGALVFLFPFYYMVIGSLQNEPDTSCRGLSDRRVDPAELLDQRPRQPASSRCQFGHLHRRRPLLHCLFGVLAGYALARLHFRGSGTLFAVMLLVQIVPFQLLIIPLYVMIVRDYGLADRYLGMIVPFAINSTAVFIFRQFFLQLPDDLFSAARIDGASELRILWSIALPLVRPALLTVILITFIGPWNEFLWPFLVTKDQCLQPLAVTLANYISNIAGRATNPSGAILAGAVVLAAPAVALFVVFQKRFNAADLSSGVKGSPMPVTKPVLRIVASAVGLALAATPLALGGAPTASAAAPAPGRLTNLAHLDWLGDTVDPAGPGAATRRTGSPSEPAIGVLWTYADRQDDGSYTRVGGGTYDPDDRHLRPGRLQRRRRLPRRGRLPAALAADRLDGQPRRRPTSCCAA